MDMQSSNKRPVHLLVLFLILYSGCATHTSDIAKTQITIIGTFHDGLKNMKFYSPEKLQSFLEKTNPEIIAAEIRPQDYAKGDLSPNPWDMNEIVVPFAGVRHIEIEPIDWWPDNMRAQYRQYYKELTVTEKGRQIYNEVEDEWAPHKKTFLSSREATPEYIHSSLFAERDSSFRSKVKKLVGEGPQNLFWYTRAEKMNENLAEVIRRHPGQRITVVVGAFHRPDIENFLKTQSNVEIKPLFQ
jgi:hypothetical protein